MISTTRSNLWMTRTGWASSIAASRVVDSTAGMTKDQLRPLVSIIVPVYNGERYLRESLDSILSQTYPHTEVIVMDDASTDGAAAILESYGNRVRIFRQPHNRGIY